MMRLRPDRLGRLFYNSLYERMVKFATEHTPEFPADPVVHKWLSRFYNFDPLIHIVIDMDESGNIVGHALFEIQKGLGFTVLTCHQIYHDSPKQGGIDEGMEYLDKLAVEVGATCIAVMVEKNANLYKKKYGFDTVRQVLIKKVGGVDVDAGEES